MNNYSTSVPDLRVATTFVADDSHTSAAGPSPDGSSRSPASRPMPALFSDLPQHAPERAATVASSSTGATEERAPAHGASGARRALGLLRSAAREAADGTAAHAYLAGFGVSSRSGNLTPFRSTTVSASPVNAGAVRHDGDAPQTIPPSLSGPASSAPRPPHDVPQGEAAAGLQAPGALAALFGADRPILRNASSFDDPQEAAARDALFEELTSIQRSGTLSGPETVLLARSLDAFYGTNAKPAARAQSALTALRETNLLGGVRALQTGADAPDSTHRSARAWLFAQQLEAIPGGVGMDLVSKLAPRASHPDGTHASVAAKERMLLGVYLKAVSQVAVEAGARRMVSADPQALFNDAEGNLSRAIRLAGGEWPGSNGRPTPAGVSLTLAEKALLAIKDELGEIDRHTADAATRGQPFSKGGHGCRFAIPMLRGGMTTDSPRNADGTRSEFDRVESRSRKHLDKHLERALRQPTGFTRIRQAVLDQLQVYQHKSPFKTYNSVVSSEGSGFGMSLTNRGGIHDGRAMLDMMGTLESGIDAQLGAFRLPGADGESAAPLVDANGKINPLRLASPAATPALQLLARAAILRQIKAETVLMPRYAQAQPLSERAAQAAGDAVIARLAHDNPDVSIDTLKETIRAVVSAENQPPTPERLLAWAGQIEGGPRDADHLRELAGQPDSRWRAFGGAFERVGRERVEPLATPSLQGKGRAEAAELIANLVRHEELGSGLSLNSAGNVQGTIKNISGVVSAVLLHGTGTVRVDAGGGYIRTASFESGTSTPRSELRFGVTTLKRVQGGIGGSGGHSFGPVTASLGGDVSQAYAVVHQDGVVYGFPRHLSGGVGGDRDLNEQKARLATMLLSGPPADGAMSPYAEPGNPEDRRSHVKRAYQEFGDTLSIGRFEYGETDHITTGSATGGVGARFGEFRLGLPQVTASGQMQFSGGQYREHSGWLRVARDTSANSFKASVSGIVAGLGGYVPLLHDSTATSLLQMSAGNLASGSVDFFHCGETDASTRIFDDGKELGTSFATRSFADPRSFVASLAQHIDTFSEDKASLFFGQQYGNEATRQEAVDREKQRVGEFVGQYLAQRDMTATPQIYWEFGPHVDTANLLEADAHLAKLRGEFDVARRAGDEVAAIHADQRYREGRFLINAKVRSQTDETGLGGVLGATYDVRNGAREQAISFT